MYLVSTFDMSEKTAAYPAPQLAIAALSDHYKPLVPIFPAIQGMLLRVTSLTKISFKLKLSCIHDILLQMLFLKVSTLKKLSCYLRTGI